MANPIQIAIEESVRTTSTVRITVESMAETMIEVTSLSADCDYTDLGGDRPGEYDVWGTIPGGDEFRLAVTVAR